jgi:hypothetical protein
MVTAVSDQITAEDLLAGLRKLMDDIPPPMTTNVAVAIHRYFPDTPVRVTAEGETFYCISPAGMAKAIHGAGWSGGPDIKYPPSVFGIPVWDLSERSRAATEIMAKIRNALAGL